MNIQDIATPDDITPEALDFIYQNAVSYLEYIHKSMEAISNRSLVLLSYLMIVIGFATSHVVSHTMNLFVCFNYHELIFSVCGFLLIVYYILIIWDIVHYSKPRWVHVAYS